MQASYHCTLNELPIHDVCRNIQDRSIFHRSRLPTVDYEHHIRSNSTRSETQEIVTIFVSERYKITFLDSTYTIAVLRLYFFQNSSCSRTGHVDFTEPPASAFDLRVLVGQRWLTGFRILLPPILITSGSIHPSGVSSLSWYTINLQLFIDFIKTRKWQKKSVK